MAVICCTTCLGGQPRNYPPPAANVPNLWEGESNIALDFHVIFGAGCLEIMHIP